MKGDSEEDPLFIIENIRKFQPIQEILWKITKTKKK